MHQSSNSIQMILNLHKWQGDPSCLTWQHHFKLCSVSFKTSPPTLKIIDFLFILGVWIIFTYKHDYLDVTDGLFWVTSVLLRHSGFEIAIYLCSRATVPVFPHGSGKRRKFIPSSVSCPCLLSLARWYL